MKLKEIAHSRTGDKGEISNISIIPWKEEDFEYLKKVLTGEKVKAYFSDLCHGSVVRYELPGIKALNFVMDKTLGGGVTRSLSLDKHGKTLGMALLEMELPEPENREKEVKKEQLSEEKPENTASVLKGKTIRIGSGAGYAGDRLDAAVDLMEHGKLDYIIFECLAERTIALGQKEKAKNPEKGYNSLLEHRMVKILPLAYKYGVKVITNMGAANPQAAARKTKELADAMLLSGMKIACVTGDDILDRLDTYMDEEVLETGGKLRDFQETILSANAYAGAEGIVKALQEGADIVITGRVSDPALTVGPLVYEFGWNIGKNPEQMGQAILAGHLLECAGQVTGGYYADPGYKEVEGLEKLGFPMVEVAEDGRFIVSKTEESGGSVLVDTCKEQTVYEIHDPKAYLTPDAVADFSEVHFTQLGKDRVLAEGAFANGRPDRLKVSVGYQDCWIGEGEISYGGSNCMERAKLAADILEKRVSLLGLALEEQRTELIGVNSLYGEKISAMLMKAEPAEVRLRFSGRCKDERTAKLLADDVEALYTNGPAGGGGAVKKVTEIVSVCSVFVPRSVVQAETEILETAPFFNAEIRALIKKENAEFKVPVDIHDPCHLWSNREEEIQELCVSAIEKKYAGKTGEILFYGPSNLQMWYSLEQDMLPYRAQNHGMGGCIDPEMIHYAPRMLYAFQPKAVFFQTGSNDLASGLSIEQIIQNKKEMYGLFLKHMPQTKLVIMSGLPLPGRQQYWEDTVKTNGFLSELCAATDRLYFMDATDHLMCGEGPEEMRAFDGRYFNPAYYRFDGIHLNKAGHDVWTGLIKQMLQELGIK